MAPFEFRSLREISILKSHKNTNGLLRKNGPFSFVMDWMGDQIGFSIGRAGFTSHLHMLGEELRVKMLDPDQLLSKPEYFKILRFGSQLI